MNFKRGPFILLLVLSLILIFIFGVRYGQRVEKTNKAINYLLSLPPTKPPEPTQKPLSFQTYINKDCAVQFLYPVTVNLVKNSTFSAVFNEKGKEQIELNCENKNKLMEIINNEEIKSEEISFKKTKIQTKLTNLEKVYVFKFYNPINAKNIYVAITKSLYPLFEKSLEFVTK